MNKRKISYIILGSIITFSLCSLFHFAYEFLGKPRILAGIFPVSESIWEHFKLPFYSLLVLNLLPWCSMVKRMSLKDRLVFAMMESLVSIIVVFFGYYGLKGGFALEGLAVDLGLLALGILLSLAAAAVLTEERMAGKDKIRIPAWLQWLLLVLIPVFVLVFYLFSYDAPDFPVFH